MKPIYAKALIFLFLFSYHIQTRANNKPAPSGGGFSLTSFNPMAANANDTIQIIGTGFTGSTSVSFGGVTAAFIEVVSSTRIRAHVGAGASGNLVVSDGVTVDSLSGFVFQSPPQIQSVSPAQGYLGDTIYFHGKNLIGITRIEGVDSFFTVVSDTLIRARVSGWAPIIRFYKTAGSMLYMTLFTGFTYLDSTMPAIISFTPATAAINQPVTIRGLRFTNTTKVQFGTGLDCPFTVVSDSVIIANPIHGSSSGSISVTTNKGTGSRAGFTFLDYVPLVVSSFSPDTAKTGDVVIIRGMHLLDVDGVYFGGVPAKSFTTLSDSVVIAVVGEGASGYIKLTGTWNGADSLSGFTYYSLGPVPEILGITPDSAGEGATVRITGHHFSNVTAVVFGGNPAASYQIISDSAIDVVLGSCCSGNVDVINPAGLGYWQEFYYNFFSPPFIPDTGYSISSFTVHVENGNAIVRWEIGSESAIGNFIVQRAPDSLSFLALDSVAPINNRLTNDYSITDAHMLNGLNNYRLAVVDTLGNIRYSIIVTAMNTTVTNTIKLHPNPATSNLTIAHPSSSVISSITILDMMGKKLKTVNVPANTTETKIILSNTYEGLFRVVWTDGNRTSSQNLLIKSH